MSFCCVSIFSGVCEHFVCTHGGGMLFQQHAFHWHIPKTSWAVRGVWQVSSEIRYHVLLFLLKRLPVPRVQVIWKKCVYEDEHFRRLCTETAETEWTGQESWPQSVLSGLDEEMTAMWGHLNPTCFTRTRNPKIIPTGTMREMASRPQNTPSGLSSLWT